MFSYLLYHILYTPSIYSPISCDIPNTVQADPVLGYKPIENLNVIFPIGNTTIQHVPQLTNDRGVRIASKNSAQERETSIITIGCSQTWGQGVFAENTFSNLLQTLLEKSVTNLGVPGYSSVNAFLRLKQFWDLNPKIIIYAHGHELMSRSLCTCAPNYIPYFCIHQPHIQLTQHHLASFIKPRKDNTKNISLTMRYIRENGANHPKNSFLTGLYWKYQTDIAKIKLTLGKKNSYILPKIEDEERAFQFFLPHLKQEVDTHRATLIIVYIPNYFQDPIPRAPRYVVEICQRENIKLIDMSDAFNKYAMSHNRELLFIPEDGHLSVAAHQLIAYQISNYIKNEKLL